MTRAEYMEHAHWRHGEWLPGRVAQPGRKRARTRSRFPAEAQTVLKAARAFDVTPLVVAVADSTAVTSLADLQAVVEELQREMVRLRAEIANLKAPQEVPDVVEERPKKEIINQVLAYYDAHPHQDLYPSDVAQALSLDAFSVYEITNQLVADGRLR